MEGCRRVQQLSSTSSCNSSIGCTGAPSSRASSRACSRASRRACSRASRRACSRVRSRACNRACSWACNRACSWACNRACSWACSWGQRAGWQEARTTSQSCFRQDIEQSPTQTTAAQIRCRGRGRSSSEVLASRGAGSREGSGRCSMLTHIHSTSYAAIGDTDRIAASTRCYYRAGARPARARLAHCVD